MKSETKRTVGDCQWLAFAALPYNGLTVSCTFDFLSQALMNVRIQYIYRLMGDLTLSCVFSRGHDCYRGFGGDMMMSER
jgi:hypothetical protein